MATSARVETLTHCLSLSLTTLNQPLKPRPDPQSNHDCPKLWRHSDIISQQYERDQCEDALDKRTARGETPQGKSRNKFYGIKLQTMQQCLQQINSPLFESQLGKGPNETKATCYTQKPSETAIPMSVLTIMKRLSYESDSGKIKQSFRQ